MSEPAPETIFAELRRQWAWRGLAGGALFGAVLMTFLIVVAGNRAQLGHTGEVLLAYAAMTLLLAILGAVLGWFHGGTEANRQLASRGVQPPGWGVVLQEAGMGFRIGLIVALLYVVIALGVFLEQRTFPLWLLAARASLALIVFPAGVGLAGLCVGLARPR